MYAKTFPYAYVNTVLCLMEWKHLPHTCMQESHYYSESFTCYLISQSTHFLCLIYHLVKMILSDSCITIKSAHFYTCVIKESFSTNWAHLRLRDRKRKNTGCCCQERSELIVWMFLTTFTSSSCIQPIWLHRRALSLEIMQRSLFVAWRSVNRFLNELFNSTRFISLYQCNVFLFFLLYTCSLYFLCMSCMWHQSLSLF